MGTGSLSPRVKRPEREADHSPPTNAEVKQTTTLPVYHKINRCSFLER
jgi:hypothetical protein